MTCSVEGEFEEWSVHLCRARPPQPPPYKELSREKHWEELRVYASWITDRRGMHVDAGIVETVAGLWAHGVATVASCEGHDDRALPCPWIDISVGHVAQTKQMYIANDAQSDPLHYRRISEQFGYTTETILCVPMVVKGSTIGVIELINKLDASSPRRTGGASRRLPISSAWRLRTRGCSSSCALGATAWKRCSTR